MTPTRLRTLALIALIAAVAGWVVVTLVDALLGRFLPVPWTAALAIALLTAFLLVWGLLAKPRLQGQPGVERLEPVVAARTAALALASSRTGAAVFGFYAGVAIGLVPYLDTQAGRDYAWSAAGASLASIALVIVALWLERMCRLPEDDEQSSASGTDHEAGPAQSEANRVAS